MTIVEMTKAAATLYERVCNEEIDEQTKCDTLEGMGLEEKLKAYACIIRQLELDVDSFKEEEERLHKRRKTIEGKIQWMEKRVLDYMQASGESAKKVGSFRIRVTSGKAAQIVNEELLNRAYFIPQPPKLDKAAVREDLLAGKEVPGAVLSESQGVTIR